MKPMTQDDVEAEVWRWSLEAIEAWEYSEREGVSERSSEVKQAWSDACLDRAAKWAQVLNSLTLSIRP